MKLLVINGPNLNLLGLREPAIYGSQNYESLLTLPRRLRCRGHRGGLAQSNHEGIVDAIRRPTASMTASSSAAPTLTPA
ncbi:MAG: type II 3-dehydroquinate dehydratase [Dysosmobacter welbionis]